LILLVILENRVSSLSCGFVARISLYLLLLVAPYTDLLCENLLLLLELTELGVTQLLDFFDLFLKQIVMRHQRLSRYISWFIMSYSLVRRVLNCVHAVYRLD
jgi:hypothetical protein